MTRTRHVGAGVPLSRLPNFSESTPQERDAHVVIHGWRVFAHPLFLERFEDLIQQVAELRAIVAHSPWRAFWLLVLAGFTPIPLKIFTWASGVVGVPLLPFLAAMLVGRGKRVYLLALVLRLGGERAERALHRWIEHLGWAAMMLLAVLVGWLLLRGPAA